MADLYFDHNVSERLLPELRISGHRVTTARDIGLETADDAYQLTSAAENGWVLVTNNRKDFRLLHTALQLWAERWGLQRQHAGIVILPGALPAIPGQLTALVTLLDSGAEFHNRVHEWREGRWQLYPPP